MSEENSKDAELAFEEHARLSGHAHGHIHPHIHEHIQEHFHGQANPHWHGGENAHPAVRRILTIRSHSGLSGDMLLTGLAVLNLDCRDLAPQSPEGQAWIEDILNRIMPGLGGHVLIEQAEVHSICGWRAKVNLPDSHTHRNLRDIIGILDQNAMNEWARERAIACFQLLAKCEAEAHGIDPDDVHFHEVGALDSILDICAVCELMACLNRPEIVCGHLPVADGHINCAHGILPAPAPATLRLLRGVPVKAFAGDANAGELLTPTSLALLHALHAHFGKWPHFRMTAHALVYGQRVFANAPNGVIFAMGEVEESGSDTDKV